MNVTIHGQSNETGVEKATYSDGQLTLEFETGEDAYAHIEHTGFNVSNTPEALALNIVGGKTKLDILHVSVKQSGTAVLRHNDSKEYLQPEDYDTFEVVPESRLETAAGVGGSSES